MQYQRHLSPVEDLLVRAAGREPFLTLPDARISRFPKRDDSFSIWSVTRTRPVRSRLLGFTFGIANEADGRH